MSRGESRVFNCLVCSAPTRLCDRTSHCRSTGKEICKHCYEKIRAEEEAEKKRKKKAHYASDLARMEKLRQIELSIESAICDNDNEEELTKVVQMQKYFKAAKGIGRRRNELLYQKELRSINSEYGNRI